MLNQSLDENAFLEQAKNDQVTHITTGIAFFRDNKLLVVRRLKSDIFGGVYEIPGGGVDEGETIEEGAMREGFEETGLKVRRVIGTFKGFDFSTPTKKKVRQINYLVKAEEGEVKLEPSEHDDFKWISENELDSLSMTDEMKGCVRLAFKLYFK
jgi:8-oxo-dGTP diphosphatase